jgi:sporulation protein YlmC with PRC-barrel domain
MRAISLALASGLALATFAALPALAQQLPTIQGNPAGVPAAAPRQPAPNPLKSEDVSAIKGTAVYGSDDKKIGSVATVLMQPDNKKIDRLVVSSGGVLGMGARDVAIPLDQFSWDAGRGGFKLAKTNDELKSMAEWKAPDEEAGSGSSMPPPAATAPIQTRDPAQTQDPASSTAH